VKRAAALLAAGIVLATAGYAAAGGSLRIIRLHAGQSVMIGNVKVVALGGATRTTTVTTTVARIVTAPGGATTVAGANACSSRVAYPGDGATREAIAQWMAHAARARRVPGELPVMAALETSGLRNLSGGDRDDAGYFGMRLSVWNTGKYAGYPTNPELQLTWFIDQALTIWANRVAAGDLTYGNDPQRWGDWVADVERPAAQYRGRYQLRLDEARALLGAGCSGTG
jgi:hypothetical protein